MHRILLFHHHAELTLSLCLLFGKRLGMTVCIGDDTTFLEQVPEGKHQFAPLPVETLRRNADGELNDVPLANITYEEFMDSSFDYVLATRAELVPLTEFLRKKRPNVTYLCYSGNPACPYPEEYFYIGADIASYHLHMNKKILILLEVLPCFQYAPLEETYRKTVRSFPNFMHQSPFYQTLLECEKIISDYGYRFYIHGHQGRDGAYGDEELRKATAWYQNMLAAIHLKDNDGYGLSLQHIALSGRGILTAFEFYVGRTLWPVVQTWGYDVDPYDGKNIAKVLLENADKMEKQSERQANWCREFFNYEREAERVKEFLESL